MPIQEISRQIVAECERHFRETHKALLTSALGLHLGKAALREIRESTGRGLLDFLRNDLTGSVRILRSGVHRNIFGIVPAGAQLDGPDDRYFRFEDPGHKATISPRYIPAVWAAFAKRLDPGVVRCIDPDDGFRWQEKIGEECAPNFLPISHHMVPPEDTQDREKRIIEAIENWAYANQIPVTDMILQSQRLHENLLQRVIDCLAPGELSRLEIPGDIIAKLLRTRL